MRSNVRSLVIVGAFVVVLGGALAALKLTGNDKSASSSSVSTASIELVSKKSEDVVSMKVTNAKGSYTLLPVTKGGVGSSLAASASSDSSSSGSSNVSWTVKELAGCRSTPPRPATPCRTGLVWWRARISARRAAWTNSV